MTAPTVPGQPAGRLVIELERGVTVYPPREEREPWRAVWAEDGRRRFREAVTGEKLAAKLEKVTERLQAGALNMERPGADLLAYYLSPGRLPVQEQWSRKKRGASPTLSERAPSPRPDEGR